MGFGQSSANCAVETGTNNRAGASCSSLGCTRSVRTSSRSRYQSWFMVMLCYGVGVESIKEGCSIAGSHPKDASFLKVNLGRS